MALGSGPIGSRPLGAGPRRLNPQTPIAGGTPPLGVRSEYVEEGYFDDTVVEEVVKSSREWPNGLDDLEAITRLQSVMIAACEGNRDISSDRDYKSLRTPLLKRKDLTDVVPSYIRAHRDLNSMWAYLKGISGQWQPRREHVWETFRPLLDRVEESGENAAAPVTSSSWTGRPTTHETAVAVRALGPSALESVDWLIAELEPLGGNGGPGAEEAQEALSGLRELRDALSALITAVERDAALEAPLGAVVGCTGRVIKLMKDNFDVSVANFSLVGVKAVVAMGVATTVNYFHGSGGEAAGAFASELVGGLVQPKTRK